MKVVTFNVNGIRARLHQLKVLIEKHQPDVIGLQEIKVTDEDFPVQAINDLGYHIEFHGQKTHYGVALMSKKKPLSVTKGFATDEEDAQRRMITAQYESDSGYKYTVMNGYFPQGESRDHATKFPAKQKFYKDLMATLQADYKAEDPVLVMGDFNISHTDTDIGIGPDNAKRWLRTGKCSFLQKSVNGLITFWPGALLTVSDNTLRRMKKNCIAGLTIAVVDLNVSRNVVFESMVF